jgi:hypothetical protein
MGGKNTHTASEFCVSLIQLHLLGKSRNWKNIIPWEYKREGVVGWGGGGGSGGVNTGVTQSRFIGIDSFLFSYLSLKFSFFFFSDTHMRKRRRSRMIHLTYRRRILRITSVTTFLRRKFFSIQKGKIMSLTCHPGRHDEKEWDDGH